MASCKAETQTYRKCLKDAHQAGCGAAKACAKQAKVLEACRESWRKENAVELTFDGTRTLPNKKCSDLNSQVQKCMKWKKNDERKCQEPIVALRKCMESTQGVVVAPTEGDKLWSDYKGPK